jgi:hypothetical protein
MHSAGTPSWDYEVGAVLSRGGPRSIKDRRCGPRHITRQAHAAFAKARSSQSSTRCRLTSHYYLNFLARHGTLFGTVRYYRPFAHVTSLSLHKGARKAACYRALTLVGLLAHLGGVHLGMSTLNKTLESGTPAPLASLAADGMNPTRFLYR